MIALCFLLKYYVYSFQIALLLVRQGAQNEPSVIESDKNAEPKESADDNTKETEIVHLDVSSAHAHSAADLKVTNQQSPAFWT